MSDQIDVQAIIEQLVGRIAQLELEVAVLKAARGFEAPPTEEPPASGSGEPAGGYM